MKWVDFKTLVASKRLMLQYKERSEQYDIFAYDGNIRYECSIVKDAVSASRPGVDADTEATNQTDFEDNYKDKANGVVGDVTIREEPITTGGHYSSQSFEHTVPDTIGWTEKDISFPFPVGILAAKLIIVSEYTDDVVEFLVAPDTVIGTITADVAVDDTEISVAASVTANAQIGYTLEIDGEDLGRVVDIDMATDKVTMESAATSAHTTGGLVKQTAKYIPHLKLKGDNVLVEFGNNKIGTGYVPANTILKLRYYNHEAVAKEFTFMLEYLY